MFDDAIKLNKFDKFDTNCMIWGMYDRLGGFLSTFIGF